MLLLSIIKNAAFIKVISDLDNHYRVLNTFTHIKIICFITNGTIALMNFFSKFKNLDNFPRDKLVL